MNSPSSSQPLLLISAMILVYENRRSSVLIWLGRPWFEVIGIGGGGHEGKEKERFSLDGVRKKDGMLLLNLLYNNIDEPMEECEGNDAVAK